VLSNNCLKSVHFDDDDDDDDYDYDSEEEEAEVSERVILNRS